MPTATLVATAPWPLPLDQARSTSGPVAVADADGATAESWVVAVALSVSLPDRDVVVIVDPERRPPGLLAAMAATFDALSGGRLVLALRPVGSSGAAVVDEVYTIVDRLLRGETVDHDGPAFRLFDAKVALRPARQPRPPLLLPGRTAGEWEGDGERWRIEPAPGTAVP